MKIQQKLTRKQQAFVDYLTNNPKSSGTQAVLATYNTTDPVVAASISYENLRKPQIMVCLASYSDLCEETILQVIRDWGNSSNTRRREIATRNAQWVHNQVYGLATTRIETQPTLTKISINLSGDGTYPPPEMLED